MKQYVAPNQMRIVGKAWEIRHQLRKLAAESGHLPLARFTGEHPPLTVKLGGSHRSRSVFKSG